MSKPLANVEVSSDTFAVWLARTNEICSAVTTEIITANSTYANTGNTATPRHAQLFGTFTANTLIATGGIRGGNVSTSANLTITSNVAFTGNTFTSTANTLNSNTQFFTANVQANGALVSILGSNLNITSNTTITAAAISLAGPVTFNTDLVTVVSANGNIGNNSADRLIYTFPKATYRTGKLLVQATNSGNNQISEMIIAHDNTNAYMTVYGIVASPPGSGPAPLGTFNVTINSANVEVYMTQVLSNSAVKVVAQLIK